MAQHAKDLTGQRFGKWEVLERDGTLRNHAAWLCRCDCGTVRRITSNTLRSGRTRGCLHCHRRQKPPINLTVGDRTMTLAEWSTETGIKAATIYTRHRSGWSPEDAVSSIESGPTVPDSKVSPEALSIRLAFRELGLTAKQLGERLGCSRQAVIDCLNNSRNMHRATVEKYAKALGCKVPKPPREKPKRDNTFRNPEPQGEFGKAYQSLLNATDEELAQAASGSLRGLDGARVKAARTIQQQRASERRK